MLRVPVTSIGAVLLAITLGSPALAQAQPPRPQIETKKVDGTDNVYIFRNGNHQAMFIVTKDGVIATDPVAYGRPHGRPALCRRDQEGHRQADQIPDLQPPPLRPHRRRQGVQGRRRHDHRAQERQGASRAAQGPAHAAARRGRSTTSRTIKLGGTTLELHYLGLNHSDSTLVMRLPKEKIIFVVDTIRSARCRAAA